MGTGGCLRAQLALSCMFPGVPVYQLQRDGMVRHAYALRNYSRKRPKAHTHMKRQPTNVARAANSNPPTRVLYMHLTRTPHTHHTVPCATRNR